MPQNCKRFGVVLGSVLVGTVLPACNGLHGKARATGIATGLDHACALLDKGRAECWGLDERGRLGRRAPGATADAGTEGGTTLDAGLSPDAGPDAGTDGGLPPPVAPPAEVEGLDTVRALAAGAGYTCAILLGGEVRCWGDNSYGQLGSSAVPTGGYSVAPVTVGSVSGARSLSAGTTHSCALLEDGGVACWGLDDVGQLGDPAHPVQGATAVAVGARHSCAVVEGGVFCWGDNSVGQLGASDGNALAPFSGATDVAAGGNESCALRSGGSVLCWGSLDPDCKGGCGQAPSQIQLTGPARKLAVGPLEACALLDSDSIECWDKTGATRPVKGVSGAKDLDVGVGFGCAVLADASVVCWGDNSAGQLGDGTTAQHSGLVPVPL